MPKAWKWLSRLLVLLILLQTALPAGQDAAGEAGPAATGARTDQAPAVSAISGGPEKLPAWASAEIAALRSAGIVKGYEDGSFRPDRQVTAQEFTTLLLRLDGIPGPGDAASSRTELSQALTASLENDLPYGSYRAYAPVSRVQAAYAAYRLFGVEDGEQRLYSDNGSIGKWAADAVQAVSGAGWMQGYEDGSFRGDSMITRAQAAVVIYRILEWLKRDNRHLIAVRAADSAGKPLRDAAVLLHGKGARAVSNWGTTDALGLFWLLAPYGEYEVNAAKGSQLASGAAAFNADSRIHPMKAEQAAVISGKLLGDDGKAATGYALALTANPTFFAVTEKDGSFRAYVQPEREYRVALIDDSEIGKRAALAAAQKGTATEAVIGRGAVPAALRLIDAPPKEREICDCRFSEPSGSLKAPAAGETLDMGLFSFADTRLPGDSRTTPPVGPPTSPPPTSPPPTSPPPTSPPPTSPPPTSPPPTSPPPTSPPPTSPPPTSPPPTSPDAPTGLTAEPFDSSVALRWNANAESDLAGYKLYMSTDGGSTWSAGPNAGASPSRTVTGLTNGLEYRFAVAAYDTEGLESERSAVAQAKPQAGAVALPPDPADVAPELSLSEPTSFDEMAEFLYAGEHPVQIGVDAGAVEPDRVAVLRGKALGGNGEPLPGVRVSAAGHEEWGYTFTRADGMFDLVVNGGRSWLLQYERNGYMTVQRKAEPPWADYMELPDVTLLSYDNTVTLVGLTGTEDYQIAQGGIVTDADGTRQGTLVVPPGTSGSMTLPDGSVMPLDSMHFRATEYTVGDGGPSAMPGELPSFVGYTYAVELSADEAVAAGATDVGFNQPLYYYVDNFLDFPVGETVPVGYYDREAGNWVPSDNGVIIGIVDVADGKAVVDIDGDGGADADADLAAIGLTPEELAELARLYEPGQSLWRVPVEHFTPWDCNWPYGPPPDAMDPPDKKPRGRLGRDQDPCNKQGSVIGCQDQTVGEIVPITGTDASLVYQSKRSRDYTERGAIEVPLSDGDIPGSLKRIELTVDIAGRRIVRSFRPAANLSYLFRWDGLDSYGRSMYGGSKYTMTVAYEWNAQYYASASEFDASFGRLGSSVTIIGGRNTQTVQTIRTWSGYLESPILFAADAGIAGWSLDMWQMYDPGANMLMAGNGTSRTIPAYATEAAELRYRPDPSKPDAHTLSDDFDISGMTVDSAGRLYFTATDYKHETQIYELGRDGLVKPLPAPSSFDWYGLTTDAEGTLYVDSNSQTQIFRKKPSEPNWTWIAGSGIHSNDIYQNLDGKSALEADFTQPGAFAKGQDGAVYFIDYTSLFKLEANGLLTQLSARKQTDDNGVDAGRVSPDHIGKANAFKIADDGSIVVQDDLFCGAGCFRSRFRKITPEGVISPIGGNLHAVSVRIEDGMKAADAAFTAADMMLGRDGSIYFVETNQNVLYQITPEGMVETVASDAIDSIRRELIRKYGYSDRNMTTELLGIDAQGGLYISVSHSEIRGGDAYFRVDATVTRVVSEDGMQVYEFDQQTGRHLRTLSLLSGAVLYSFDYDASGRLIAVVDRDGRTLAVERDDAGRPTAIVAPNGQRTALQTDAEGRLAAIAPPYGQPYGMKYERGLLTAFTDSDGGVSTYEYDGEGRLTRATDPLGGVKTLSRTETENGYIAAFTDPGNRTTTYELAEDAAGSASVFTTTEPSGESIVTTVQGQTETAVLSDGTAIKRTYAYDPLAPQTSRYVSELIYTPPSGAATAFREQRSAAFDAEGKLASYTVTHTLNGDLSSVVYDAAARKLTERTAEGTVTETYMDARDRVIRIEWPYENLFPIEYEYDDQGHPVLIAQGDKFVRYRYDGLGRIDTETDAFGSVKRYEYDEAGRISAITTSGGKVYGKSYDNAGNLTGLTMPDGTAYSQQFNANGQLEGFGPSGAPLWYDPRHDSAGNLLASAMASGRFLTYALEENGAKRPLALADADIIRSFAYDANSDDVRTIDTVMPGDETRRQTIAYGYTGENVSSMALSGKAIASLQYGYDDYFNLASIVMTVGDTTNTTALQYDRNDNLVRYGPFTLQRTGPLKAVGSMSDGAFDIRTSYDQYGKISGVVHLLHGTPISSTTYTYDLRGFATDATTVTASGTETVHYEYDADGQLIGAARTSAEGEADTEAYSYDANKNRLSRQIGSAPPQLSAYDETGALRQNGATVYLFDADGYMTRRGGDTFRYGLRGELLEATVTDATYKYTYDGLGRRVARENAAGETTQYIYGNPESLQLLTASVDADGKATVYDYNEDGLLVALERDGQRYYVVADAVGTPQLVLDDSGEVVKRLRYDSYGVPLSDSNPAFDLPIGYAGGLEDRGTGLVRFGSRDYDPASGRWTARDPVLFESGQANLYAYVNNNPVMLRDVCGQFCVGASGYGGVGMGGKVCVTEDGFSSCLETGFGAGGGLEITPFEDISNNELTMELTGKASFGFASLTAGYKLAYNFDTHCRGDGPLLKGEAGPFAFDAFSPSESGVSGEVDNFKTDIKELFDTGGSKAEAALKVKYCRNYRW